MPGQHYGKRVKADQIGISKGDPDVHKVVAVSILFKPSEIVAIDKLNEVYSGSGRSGIVRRIVKGFIELDDDKQRATMISEELFQKKAAAVLAKQNAEKELERIEADIKRIGCEEKKP